MSRHRVALVALQGTPIFELAVPCEVFGIDRSDLAADWYDFAVYAATDDVSLAHGFSVPPGLGLAGLTNADTVLVPGCRSVQHDAPPELLAALRAAHSRGARIAGICSGAFVLGQAGLLRGLHATTHWMHAGELARRFSGTTVDADALYVQQGQIWTSAGTAAAIDLCLELVRRDHGAAIANEVARRMVTPPHRSGGQAQYIRTASVTAEGDPLASAFAWVRANLDHNLSISDLARHAGMSHRTLIRRFWATTRSTPQQWLTRERVLAAQRLLEATSLPIDRVAERSGHGTGANLRLQFQRHVGLSPSAYRDTFKANDADRADVPAN